MNWRKKILLSGQALSVVLFLSSLALLLLSFLELQKDTTARSKSYLKEQKICQPLEKQSSGLKEKSTKSKN